MPRRTWLDSKIDVFLEDLAASGMHLDRQRAGELITGQVRAVAALLRVTGATARTYLGDEVIKDMARRMLFEVAGERPGADLMEAPRTVPLSLALVGITVAALAEAMQVRAANEPPAHLGDVITTYAQTLSGFGQITGTDQVGVGPEYERKGPRSDPTRPGAPTATASRKVARPGSVAAPGRAEQASDLCDGRVAGLDVAHGGARGLVPGLGHDQLERNLLVAEVGRRGVPAPHGIRPSKWGTVLAAASRGG